MKKKLSAMLGVSLLFGSLLVGCGGNDTSKDDTSTNDTATENGGLTTDDITLTVWESLEGPDDFIKQAGDAFTEKHPNITIDFQNVEVGDSTTQIALDGPAGVGPDVFAAPHDKLGELVTGSHILAVEDTDTVKSLALESALDAVTYDGTVYGFPVSAETYALFYNRDLIAEEDVPTTWEDLKKLAENFTGSDRAFIMDVGNIYFSILFTTSSDNRLFGEDGTDTANSNINSDASVEGMEFFQSLRDVIDIAAADLTTSVADALFSGGQAAMHITGPWNVAVFEDAGIDFGVTTLPSLPGNDTPASSFSGTRTMFVSAYSEHPAEAAAFAEFLMSDDMQKLRYDITGALPATNIEVDSEWVEGFLNQLKYAYPMPSVPQMSVFWDAGNAASADIWDGADVRTTLDAVNTTLMDFKE